MTKSDIYYEMNLNASLLYKMQEISNEDFYKIVSILRKPELLSGLELNSLISMFQMLRINEASRKIPVISNYKYEEVLDKLMENRRINIPMMM